MYKVGGSPSLNPSDEMLNDPFALFVGGINSGLKIGGKDRFVGTHGLVLYRRLPAGESLDTLMPVVTRSVQNIDSHGSVWHMANPDARWFEPVYLGARWDTIDSTFAR
jgi:hypothetical protein